MECFATRNQELPFNQPPYKEVLCPRYLTSLFALVLNSNSELTQLGNLPHVYEDALPPIPRLLNHQKSNTGHGLHSLSLFSQSLWNGCLWSMLYS
ncbi:hypothetical protein SLA2020_013590 [Shorea laevis]